MSRLSSTMMTFPMKRTVTVLLRQPQLTSVPKLLVRAASSAASSSSPSSFPTDDHVRHGHRSHVHFNQSPKPHPLEPPSVSGHTYETDDNVAGDHSGRQQNHIWTKEELDEALVDLHRHKPSTVSDHVVRGIMNTAYHTFNFITGYNKANPTVRSIEYRLIILESIAGVPGFVAAGFRHFKSLRSLDRDHGWIATLLEEAENERMHLLTCLKMFNAGFITRQVVVAAQMFMTPLLMSMYIIQPKSMHRFVGYLEETACHTYVDIIEQIETPGTNLNLAWKDLPAPAIAKGYWKLSGDAKWVDTLKCIMADETHHRDVNHTFASMKSDDPNPYVLRHAEDAARAWRLAENASSVDTIRTNIKIERNNSKKV